MLPIKWSKYSKKYNKDWEKYKQVKGCIGKVVSDQSAGTVQICAHLADLLQAQKTQEEFQAIFLRMSYRLQFYCVKTFNHKSEVWASGS